MASFYFCSETLLVDLGRDQFQSMQAMDEPNLIPQTSQWTRENQVSPARLLEGERAAAYELGFRSFMLRLAFHNLTLIPLEEDWGARGLHTDAPRNSSSMELALDDLAEFVNETLAREIRQELTELSSLNEQIHQIATELPLDRYEQLRRLVSLANKSWRRMRIRIERAFKGTGHLDHWRLMGEAIGRYMLGLGQQPIEVTTAPPVTPIIRAAQLLCTQDTVRMPLLLKICNAESIYEQGGPFAFFRAVIHPSSRITFDENGVSESCSVVQYMVLLADDFMEGIRLRDVIPNDESQTDNSASRAIQSAPSPAGEILSRSDRPHKRSEARPEQFRYGPLTGRLNQLAEAILAPAGKKDPRALRTKARDGILWIIENGRAEYEIWFWSDDQFKAAKQRFDELSNKSD